VAARFNQAVVDHLVEGAKEGFKSSGVAQESIDFEFGAGIVLKSL